MLVSQPTPSVPSPLPINEEQNERNHSMQSGTSAASTSLPVSNAAYDVIATLHEKLQGMEAMQQYAKDGNASLWQQMSQADIQSVNTLCGELERIVQAGQLHAQAAGRR